MSVEKQLKQYLPLFLASAALLVALILLSGNGGGRLFGAEQSYPVRLNEIMTSNRSYADKNGCYTDYIELYNTADYSIPIGGFRLTDGSNRDSYVFPEDTVIAAHSYLVVHCSSDLQDAYYAPFGLSSRGGEKVSFLNKKGVVLDGVQTVDTGTDLSMVRDASGAWTLSGSPTPGYENSDSGHKLLLEQSGAVTADVYITELMASNKATMTDGNGEFTDWLELTNLGSTTVNLGGWFLSDDPEALTAWEFPALSLAAGERLVLFCGGKAAAGELHTEFSLSSDGETVYLSAPGGVLSDSFSFPTAESDSSIVRDPKTGAIAETRYPTPGYPDTEEGFEAFCNSRNGNAKLVIWELMTSNKTYYIQNGEGYDWVELKNVSNEVLKLSDYSLTDSVLAPDQYILPDISLAPGEYVLVFLSGDESLTGRFYHAGFSLNAKSDRLYLYRDNLPEDFILAENIPLNGSIGRQDAAGGYFYMTTPTPGQDNEEGFRRISDKPSFSVEPGVYMPGEALTVELSSAGEIRYTTDGTEPTAASSLYTEPLVLEKSTILRAIALEDGKVTSRIATGSYIFYDTYMPVCSLVAPPDSLFGSKGIYKSNWKVKSINVYANLSYYGLDGSFATDCDISLHGMTSILVRDKKSFTVHFRNCYDGNLNYDLFEDGCTDYSSILLRAAVEGAVSTMMRDSIMGEVTNEYSTACMGMKNKYAVLFINGEYWGVYSLREHYSTEYYASRMNTVAENCQMLKGFSLRGDDLYEVRRYMEKHSPMKAEAYEYVKSKIDVESFADWIILESFTGNFDVNGNMRYFWSSVDDKWRCAVCDVDLGFYEDDCFEVPRNALQHGHMVRALMKNTEFQQLLTQRLSYWMNGPLKNENFIQRINDTEAYLMEETKKDAVRWHYSFKGWQRAVNGFRRFCSDRAEEMLRDYRHWVRLSDEEMSILFPGVYQKK